MAAVTQSINPAIDKATLAQRDTLAPYANVWVDASAGSGKTKVLTERVLRLLIEGAAPENILCLTYTKAAAAEMQDRLLGRLERWSTCDDNILQQELIALDCKPTSEILVRARSLFFTLIDTSSNLAIQTVHSFCQSLLQQFPMEADMAPGFNVLNSETVHELKTIAARSTWQVAENEQRYPGLLDAIGHVAQRAQDGRMSTLVNSLANDRKSCAFFKGFSVRQYEQDLRAACDISPDITKETLEATRTQVINRDIIRECSIFLAEKGSTTQQTKGQAILDFLASDIPTDSQFSKYQSAFLTQKLTVMKSLAPKPLQKIHPAAQEAMQEEAERLLTLAHQEAALTLIEDSCALAVIAHVVHSHFTMLKAATNNYDFDDLISKTNHLLENTDKASWILYRLDKRIHHILVDEAQDTSGLQWQVVEALTADAFSGEGQTEQRSLFVVGDYKQSIYSFQGADPARFLEKQNHFEIKTHPIQQEWRSIQMDVSFRTAPAILDFVDTVFKDPMAQHGVCQDTLIEHTSSRLGQEGIIELWPLVEEDEKLDLSWTLPIERIEQQNPANTLARNIASTIKEWLETGEQLPSRGRAITPGDILILVRNRKGIFHALPKALRDAGIPIAPTEHINLKDQLSSQDLTAFFRFLCLPEDDFSLACLLKSPLFGVSEDELFTLCHGRSSSLWQSLQDQEHRTVTILKQYLQQAYTAPSQLLHHLLYVAGGKQRLVAELGENTREIIDLYEARVRAFEEEHLPLLQHFLYWYDNNTMEEKRVSPPGDTVRILTAHGSKGLQAPIVILADTTSSPDGQSPSIHWHDDLPFWATVSHPLKDTCSEARKTAARAEHNRLLYVALTRAEDRLYIAGTATKRSQDGTWYDLCATAFKNHSSTETIFSDQWGDNVQRLYQSQTTSSDRIKSINNKDTEAPALLPNWAYVSMPKQDTLTKRRTPTQDNEKQAHGVLVHELLYQLSIIPQANRSDFKTIYNETAFIEAVAILDNPAFTEWFGDNSAGEVAMTNGTSSLRIDRLLYKEDYIGILDFKTGDITKDHSKQLSVYRHMVRACYPDKPIKCFILWTQTAILEEVILDDASQNPYI